MLRITTETKRGKVILSVEGRLAGPALSTLEECWRELRAVSPKKKLIVDLCGVSFIDNRGKVLLKEIHHQGGQLLAEGCLNQAIVSEILLRKKKSGRAEDAKGSTIIFYLMFLTLTLIPARTFAHGQQQNSANAGNATAQVLHLTLDQAVALGSMQIVLDKGQREDWLASGNRIFCRDSDFVVDEKTEGAGGRCTRPLRAQK